MTRKSKQPAPAQAPLTPSQRRFVDEYLIDLNGTRAYRAAFPAATYRAARVGATTLLAKPNVAAEIRAARREQQRRTRMTADKVLRELARVAFSDILDLFDADGNALEPRQVPFDARRALTGVKVTQERTTRRVFRNGDEAVTETVHTRVLEYRFASKLDALGLLFRHLGLQTAPPPLGVLLNLLPPDVAAELNALPAEQRPAHQIS
ncbi:MAG TPA: terminase small subunit [Gemmata sp.]